MPARRNERFRKVSGDTPRGASKPLAQQWILGKFHYSFRQEIRSFRRNKYAIDPVPDHFPRPVRTIEADARRATGHRLEEHKRQTLKARTENEDSTLRVQGKRIVGKRRKDYAGRDSQRARETH